MTRRNCEKRERHLWEDTVLGRSILGNMDEYSAGYNFAVERSYIERSSHAMNGYFSSRQGDQASHEHSERSKQEWVIRCIGSAFESVMLIRHRGMCSTWRCILGDEYSIVGLNDCWSRPCSMEATPTRDQGSRGA